MNSHFKKGKQKTTKHTINNNSVCDINTSIYLIL